MIKLFGNAERRGFIRVNAAAHTVASPDSATTKKGNAHKRKEKEKMRENTINKIIAFFEENEDIFNECIEELDGWNGYLNDDRYYNMDELDDLMQGKSATDLLNMAFFGHDEYTYHTDSHGNREYGAFNPNRDYFTFNGYGNLISSDYKDYSAHLDRYFVEALEEDRDYIGAIEDSEELTALFDELKNGEEDEED